mgnify:CR=1 FL=1
MALLNYKENGHFDDVVCKANLNDVKSWAHPLDALRVQTLMSKGKKKIKGLRPGSSGPVLVEEDARTSLGVFFDHQIYSKIIRTAVENTDVKIKHFNHPASFTPELFPLFDKISSWIIFLSDESDFLDHFLDRYIDKSTLFLFEHTSEQETQQKIQQFLMT